MQDSDVTIENEEGKKENNEVKRTATSTERTFVLYLYDHLSDQKMYSSCWLKNSQNNKKLF